MSLKHFPERTQTFIVPVTSGPNAFALSLTISMPAHTMVAHDLADFQPGDYMEGPNAIPEGPATESE